MCRPKGAGERQGTVFVLFVCVVLWETREPAFTRTTDDEVEQRYASQLHPSEEENQALLNALQHQ